MTSRFSACVLALLHFCLSSDSYGPQTLPDVGDAEFIKECVQTHNRFRSGVNPSASNMLYMSWDPDLAKTAKAWAKKCLFEHNTHLKEPGQAHPKFSPVGENLWTGSLSIFTVQGAITSWYNEVSAYTYATNKCRGACGHYTQIVWATSYKVGCAVHFCPRVAYSSITNAAHFICNYGPAGNYPVRPYKTGAACSDCNGEQCINQLCPPGESQGDMPFMGHGAQPESLADHLKLLQLALRWLESGGEKTFCNTRRVKALCCGHLIERAEGNAERDKVISDSKWYPEWDRSPCDEYCIIIIALRPLLLILTILATWLLPKYWSVIRASE